MASRRGTKNIICLFLIDQETISYTIPVDTTSPNGEAEAIQKLVIDKGLRFYNLSCVIDGDNVTYKAEYLQSSEDFIDREHLLNPKKELIDMETIVKKIDDKEQLCSYTSKLKKRLALRNLSEDEWINNHASGTLRKNKRIGFTYRTQYLAERVAYEFGYGFQILPRSQITFGDPISEENCHSITECGWHIERYMMLDIFGDYCEAKYIHASFRDGSHKEGVGIIVRETSAPWLPAGHIVFSIISEFNTRAKVWEDAINPF